jgi:hypothetical protein
MIGGCGKGVKVVQGCWKTMGRSRCL